MFDFIRPLIRAIVVLGIMSAGMAAYADPITDAENWFNQIKTLKGRSSRYPMMALMLRVMSI